MVTQRDSAAPDVAFVARAHVDEHWLAAGLAAIAAVAEKGHPFSASDLRGPGRDLPEPEHPSWWGALFSIARQDGLIRPVGYITSTIGSRNGGVHRLWRTTRRRGRRAA